jgi:hypothetical protein
MAVVSMQDPEVEKLFNRPKKEVLAQFFEGLQQALLNAGFMRTHDFISLQAYLLYLVGSPSMSSSPRRTRPVWLLTRSSLPSDGLSTPAKSTASPA